MHVRIRPVSSGLAATGVLLLAAVGLLSSVPGAAATGAVAPRTASATGKGGERDAGLLGTTVETLCRGLGAADSVATGDGGEPASRAAAVDLGGAEVDVPPRIRVCPDGSAGFTGSGKTAGEIAEETATRAKDANGG